MSRWLRRLLIFAFIYFFFSALIAIFVVEGAFNPIRRPITAEDQSQMQQIARLLDANLQNVALVASDGTRLMAWDIEPQHGNGNAVILLHGLGDNRFGMRKYAALFIEQGYSVLIPDARGHGDSGGRVTYGLLERNDIRQWFEWVAANHPHCIFGFGESMGAAELLQSVETEPHFCAVVAESPFATFREISYARVGQFFNVGPWLGRIPLRPMVEFAFIYARLKYNIDVSKISPQAAVSISRVPVFLIHGMMDRNIPLRHSRLIRAHNLSVVLWEVPNTDHCGTYSNYPQQFETRVLSWLGHYS